MYRIESLLSARLFQVPQIVGERIFFVSNLSGKLSLYAMNYGGSIPEPLLPPNIAMQNPHLVDGMSFIVFPEIEKILVMLDQDGDENYQPMLIPINGGFPEPYLPDLFKDARVHCFGFDIDANTIYFNAESRLEPVQTSYQVNLKTGAVVELGRGMYGMYPVAFTDDHKQVILADLYSVGDLTLYMSLAGSGKKKLVYGIPMEERMEGQTVSLSGITSAQFVRDGRGLLMICALFEDTYGLVFLDLEKAGDITPIKIAGVLHSGVGELEDLAHLHDQVFLLRYNIDGCSWLYEGEFDDKQNVMRLLHVICGQGDLKDGVLDSAFYDKAGDRFVLSFSTAVSPTQIYTVEGKARTKVVRHTQERVLGIDEKLLSGGEDASFISFDGIRISARLYMPAKELGFIGARPLVYYVHGGPQGQERPDFAWFSMPLIQFLTLNGFAVFVPNVRGSTGYGLNYTKQVDHDWGGRDRLDHVEAIKMLANDPRVDVSRAGVVGRSYGGFMTLTLALRHPSLWKAAVDMFGPFDLLTFMDRIPETWKPYFALSVGDPVKDHDFLVERSPKTYRDALACPLLVIQGKNDPRVVERESHDLVEYLRGRGKPVEYMMFENEGHDVLKYENRVTCYNGIAEFFSKQLQP